MSQSYNNISLHLPQLPKMKAKDIGRGKREFLPEQPMRQLETSSSQYDKQRPSGLKRGLLVNMHTLRGHLARSKLKIVCTLMQEGNVLQDDRGQSCVYNTHVHDPNVVPAHSKSESASSLNENMRDAKTINFKFKHLFMKDLEEVIRKQRASKDLYLSIQLLEKPRSSNTESASSNNSANSFQAQQDLEYELFGWILCKLTVDKRSIKTGNFFMKLCQPPLSNPPVDMNRVRTMEAELEFSVQLYDYSDKD